MNPILGVIFHAIGGFAAGSFYAPCKRIKGWAWESYWLVLGIFAWIIVPVIMALIVAPNFIEIITSASSKHIFLTYFFGLLWGIGGLMFGLTMRYLGISLGVSVALGFCAMFGTLVPPTFQQFFGDGASRVPTLVDLATTHSGQITLLGIAVCLIGIIICGKAGMMKENELSAEQKAETIKEFNFSKGIIVAIFAGLLSACMAFAFQAGSPIQQKAAEAGVPAVLSNIPLLVVVLLGGFTTNCVWCLLLNRKNRTYADYIKTNEGKLSINYFLCMLSGTLWYFQFFFYGMGSTQMGRFDFASWTLHMAFIIVTSNVIGLLTKEWNACSKKTINYILFGILTLLGSTVIIGLANKIAGTVGH